MYVPFLMNHRFSAYTCALCLCIWYCYIISQHALYQENGSQHHSQSSPHPTLSHCSYIKHVMFLQHQYTFDSSESHCSFFETGMELQGVLQLGTALWQHILKERQERETQDEEKVRTEKDRTRKHGQVPYSYTVLWLCKYTTSPLSESPVSGLLICTLLCKRHQRYISITEDCL